MNPSALPCSPDQARQKILVVDDDRANARIIARILQQASYGVVEANSGEEAIGLYDSIRPDLVLLDVIMPGLSGFDTCRALRAKHGHTLAPVIFVTATSETDGVVEGLAAGGVDYFTKPVHPREAIARIRTHLQNRLLQEQQRRLVDQLLTANKAKNRLLGMVAHDLRNPIASITGLTEFLIEDAAAGRIQPEQLDLINCIHDASQTMLQLVNELLDISVIESGELRIKPAAVDLGGLIEDSVTLNRINAAKKGTQIELQLESLPPAIEVDGPKIRQVIDNLISNAIKFSPPGSLVRVEAAAGSGRCTVAVIDNGPGIPQSEQHKLFKEFGRTSVSPTAGEKSTGMGLAICRRIIEAHGGEISAENRPAGGSIFKFHLARAA